MSSPSPLPARRLAAGVARPLIFAFGALLGALFLAAVISGLIIRELREPLDYARESAFAVAAQLRSVHEAADQLDLLISQSSINSLTDANDFARNTASSRAQIEEVFASMPPVDRTGLQLDELDELDELRVALFASLDNLRDLASRRWAQRKRSDALSARILAITDNTIEMTRDHNARFASSNARMTRTLSDVRYYLSTLNKFAKPSRPDSNTAALEDAANLYALNLRQAILALSHLPEYEERRQLFDRAQELFDLGHDAEGYFGTARRAIRLQWALEQEERRYEQDSIRFRRSIKSLSAANDAVTGATLESARTGLGRYQTLLIASLIGTLVLGTAVIKRYVFDAVVLPLRGLRDATLEMAGGRLDAALDTSGDDEISDLARALRTFRGVTQERAESERRLRERTVQLELANQELDEFAYVASHDLRAPLHGIDSLASFVQEDMEGQLPEESARHLNLMRARIQRLHSLLDALLEFSRVGKDNAEPVWIALNPLIMSSATLVAPPQFELIFNIEKKQVCLATTPFEHVVRNLVDNAVKHHDQDSGSIWVSASVKDNSIHLEVTDDGPGIPTKFQDRIFGMFQTLQARDKIEGSGMGLAFLKKSALHYGGSITLRSDPEHARGTTFVVNWPVTGQRPTDDAT